MYTKKNTDQFSTLFIPKGNGRHVTHEHNVPELSNNKTL